MKNADEYGHLPTNKKQTPTDVLNLTLLSLKFQLFEYF
jgi:hypothetical protein